MLLSSLSITLPVFFRLSADSSLQPALGILPGNLVQTLSLPYFIVFRQHIHDFINLFHAVCQLELLFHCGRALNNMSCWFVPHELTYLNILLWFNCLKLLRWSLAVLPLLTFYEVWRLPHYWAWGPAVMFWADWWRWALYWSIVANFWCTCSGHHRLLLW